MFEKNATLEELNISGEQAHLEAVTLGRGLPEALKGLETNNTLKVFHVNNQALGLPGASALASVLQKNSTLLELHCEDNEISLQAFTTIVNAVNHNKTILYIPLMDRDRAWSRSKVDREVSTMVRTAPSKPAPPPTKTSSMKKSLMGGRALGSRSSAAPERPSNTLGYTDQDVLDAVSRLDQTWDNEVARLQSYLARNRTLAGGLFGDEDMPSPTGSRPPTAGKLATALQSASLDRTPTLELDRQLGLDTTLQDLYALGKTPDSSTAQSLGSDREAREKEAGAESEDDGLVMGSGRP